MVIEAPGVEFAAGSETSIYAMGKLNDITDETIEPVVIEEDLRPVATYAKVRVVHASPTAGDLGLVDIHASADGMSMNQPLYLKALISLKVLCSMFQQELTFGVILQGDDTFSLLLKLRLQSKMVEFILRLLLMMLPKEPSPLLLNDDNPADAGDAGDAGCR